VVLEKTINRILKYLAPWKSLWAGDVTELSGSLQESMGNRTGIDAPAQVRAHVCACKGKVTSVSGCSNGLATVHAAGMAACNDCSTWQKFTHGFGERAKLF
jgi:hypothetical protein